MDKETREAIAVVVGGLALAFAVLMATLELVREHFGIWTVPMLALIFWREFIFTGMRLELSKFRAQVRSKS